MKKTDKNIKQLLLEYNSSREQLSEETKQSFQELNIDIVKRHETFNLEDCVTGANAIPSSVKRHAIEMLNLLKRSREEKVILSREMMQVFNYYVNEEAKVSQSINTLSSKIVLNKYEEGSLALIKAEQKLLQNRVVFIHNSFKDCVELPEINVLPFTITSDMVTYNEPVSSHSSDVDQLTDTESDNE